jgi:GTP cyclohydrolase I
MKYLKPKGVMVMMEAEHLCMSMRGVNKPGTKTVSFICRGEFENNQSLQNTFFQLVK